VAVGCLHTRVPGAPCATPAYGPASAYPSVGPGQAASARGPTARTRANASRMPSPDRATCWPALAPPADGACVSHHLAPSRSRPPPRKPLPAPLPHPPRQARALPLKTRVVAVGSIVFPPATVRHPAPRLASGAGQARHATDPPLPTPFLPRPACSYPRRPCPASKPGTPARRAPVGAAPAPRHKSSPAASPAGIPPQTDAGECPRDSRYLIRPSPTVAGRNSGRR
jgi:hypothetical protein